MHETILSQSPVLAHLLDSAPQEREIKLPEDSAEEFGKVLVYLYSKDVPIQDVKDIEGSGKELVQMYLAAQKYGVDGLKKLVLEKLEKNIHPQSHSDSFLGVVMAIAAACPESDNLLHDFLKGTFCDVLGGDDAHASSAGIPEGAKAKLQSIIRGGGQLALDVHEAQLTLDVSKSKQAKGASGRAKVNIENLVSRAEEWEERSNAWENHHYDDHSQDCDFAPN